MKELVFQVELLSDVVLNASSNTEGKVEVLDFIPGSNFLGMVAKKYSEFENSFAMFHSGAVRFGDATLLHNGKQTYKMPLSIYYDKYAKEKIYFHHHAVTDFKRYAQPKQERNGYITDDLELVEVKHNYSQKSAYNTETRTSKKGQMFGYNALQKGTKWLFNIKVDQTISQKDLDLLIETLQQSTRLGKSKSAQYGHIKITPAEHKKVVENANNLEEVVLYANSRLALVDQNGYPTFDLRALCDGLSDDNINYAKTQIKTTTFTPYNFQRKGFDAQRSCINKGSVIVLNNLTQEQLQQLKNGIGANLSEGFGELLINPGFLRVENFTLKTQPKEQETKVFEKNITTDATDTTVNFLVKRHNKKYEKLDLAKSVSDFIEQHKPLYNKKMNSQWGTIRSLCVEATEQNIIELVDDYISHGVAKEKWSGKKRTTLLDAIQNSSNKVEFTKLLSMHMPKIKENKDA